MKEYYIRVNHELGFYSFYTIKANHGHDATREAKDNFIKDFCGGTLDSKIEPGVKHKLETFIINNPDYK